MSKLWTDLQYFDNQNITWGKLQENHLYILLLFMLEKNENDSSFFRSRFDISWDKKKRTYLTRVAKKSYFRIEE